MRRDIAFVRVTGCALHVQHVSCAGTVELIRAARREGLPVTGEATPHHLLLSCDDIPADDANWKMAPPLGTREDRAAIREGVKDGTLGIFATDHAPHLSDEKQGGALRALSGFPSVQCSLLLMLELARQGVTTVENVVEKMCHAPARLFGIEGRGFVREGCKADLVLVDPLSDWQLEKADLLGKCGWSPYEGTRFRHRVLRTWVNGSLQYCQGEFSQSINSEPLRFSNVK